MEQVPLRTLKSHLGESLSPSSLGVIDVSLDPKLNLTRNMIYAGLICSQFQGNVILRANEAKRSFAGGGRGPISYYRVLLGFVWKINKCFLKTQVLLTRGGPLGELCYSGQTLMTA